MTIEVIKPGLATTVQDAGRPGYYNIGIPLSGALDQYALRVANLLVGNEESAAVLEATLLAPELVFRAPAIVAIAGAEATPKINGEPRPRNESFSVKADDHLTFDFIKSGARSYIAVAGGVDVPVVLGSRSLYGLGALGGFAGRKLAAGDVLRVGKPQPGARAGRALPGDLTPTYPRSLELRMVTGLYFHRLTEEAANAFFEDTWTVAPEADRIGYRYRKGRPLSFRERKQPFGAGSDPSNIVDAGYPYGSIQVPGGLEPIVLHRDAVSGGGYAMIGTVISADMDRVAQMQPNNLARFVEVDMATALKARAEYKAREAGLRSTLSA
jgi:biotin-dependent carboxylase-like uncharacterized protein